MTYFIAALLTVVVWILTRIHHALESQTEAMNALNARLDAMEAQTPHSLSKTRTPQTKNPAPVAINKASKTKLKSLPRIGEAAARRIIAARPFSQLEQLKEIEGISESIYQQLESQVTLD